MIAHNMIAHVELISDRINKPDERFNMKQLKTIAASLIVSLGLFSFAGCGGGAESAKPAADAPKVEEKAPGSTNPSSLLSNPYNAAESTTKKAKAK